jgi:hypothetical protein
VIVHLDCTRLPEHVYEQYDLATIEDRLIKVIKQDQLGDSTAMKLGQMKRRYICMGQMLNGCSLALNPHCANIHFVSERVSRSGVALRVHPCEKFTCKLVSQLY